MLKEPVIEIAKPLYLFFMQSLTHCKNLYDCKAYVTLMFNKGSLSNTAKFRLISLKIRFVHDI